MPPPVIRYAITDRHLRAADEGEEPSGNLAPLDRMQTEGQPQRRDLQSPATDLTQAELTRLLRQADQLRARSIDYLQLREKDLAPADLRALAAALRETLPPGTRPRLLLNLGHPEDHEATLATALAVAADGLHLPASTPAGLPAHLRAVFARAGRSSPILSTSAHTLAEVARARAARIDFILFGPIFGKVIAGQEVTPAVGLDALRAAVQAAGPVPVLALGGITPTHAEACLSTGARGLAGIRLFL